ncbi:MAG: DMT family transporter [Desulfurococcaceae archaeon]
MEGARGPAEARGLEVARGAGYLVATTALWGSSFVFITASVRSEDPFSYAFYRALIGLLALSPIALAGLRGRQSPARDFANGLKLGTAYALGLVLQGMGAATVSPALNAYLTAFSVVLVHIYEWAFSRRYSAGMLASLASSMAGLAIFFGLPGEDSDPLGMALVLAGSFAWAAEIIMASSYGTNPTWTTMGLLAATLAISAPPYLALAGPRAPSPTFLAQVSYLALACTLAATYLQLVGQRVIGPATASLIYLLEPVFATAFSVAIYGEGMDLRKALGGSLMVAASYLAVRQEATASAGGER